MTFLYANIGIDRSAILSGDEVQIKANDGEFLLQKGQNRVSEAANISSAGLCLEPPERNVSEQ